MTPYVFLAVLVALLVGLGVGKAWERYKLRDGRWIDRRRLRDTPHYMLGLNFLVDGQVDLAIDELTQATSSGGDALEIQMILGNLLRMKGQVGRAIHIHQALLQRPDLTLLEHAYVLLCLGLDFRHGGFVDRAVGAFQDVLRLDPRNRYALVNLQKLHEEQHQWAEAVRVRERILDLASGDATADRRILGFLHNEVGQSVTSADPEAAAAAFRRALDTDPLTAPAYLNLGDVFERQGDLPAAVHQWEEFTRTQPERAHLVFERLERAYGRLGAPVRFVELCERLIAAHPRDWRARLALSKHLSTASQDRRAFTLLLEALGHHPHGIALHQAMWRTLSALGFEMQLVRAYIDHTHEAVFYLDPHVCTRCRYRSTELLWQCPQCHEWNTFVEERLTPARPAPEPGPSPLESSEAS
jgi:lipopolysaccharide biosynthesis regulator YciM